MPLTTITSVTPIATGNKIKYAIMEHALSARQLRQVSAASIVERDNINIFLDLRFVDQRAQALVEAVFQNSSDVINRLSGMPETILINDPWPLTSTELSLASSRFLGQSIEGIAIERERSQRTIEKHFENLRTKLGVTSLTPSALFICHLCKICPQVVVAAAIDIQA